MHQKHPHEVVWCTVRPVGCHFVKRLTVELKGLRTRDWNSGHPLVFASFILPTMDSIWSSKEIFSCIEQWVYIWGQVYSMSLVENTTMERRGGGGVPVQGGSTAVHKERAIWEYNCTLLYEIIVKIVHR